MEQEHSNTGEGQSARVVRSAVIAIAIAWSMRVIGLVSVLVLARLLTPADFGIVALAMATLSLVEIFSSLGLRQSLLRVQDPDRSYYDTVWTLQLLVLAFLAVVVAALGPVVAWLYDEPVLAVVIAVLSTRFIFLGLANIGITDFDRNLELERDLKMRLSVRLTAFAVTLGAAFLLQSYWALVIGSVFHAICHALATYVAHPFRPRFSFSRRREMLGMSLWMFLANAAQTVQTEMERFFVGRLGSMSVVGLYSVSKDLSAIFTQEIATALNRVTFVTTAKTGKRLGDDPVRVETMLGSYALITAPLGLGLAATSGNSVSVLLGDQWGEAAPFLQWIAPAAAAFAVYKLILSSMQASGAAKLASFLAMGGMIFAATAIGVVTWLGLSPLHIAKVVLATSTSLLFGGVLLIAATERMSILRLTSAVLRPFLAAGIMAWIVASLAPAGLPTLGALTIQVALGGAVYAVSCLAIWIVSGRPAGAEQLAMGFAEKGWKRVRLNPQHR